MRILFFLESLISGGKERRAIELFNYLKQKTNYELLIVLTEGEDKIHYKYIHNLNIPIITIKRQIFKKDPRLFVYFYKIVRDFKPDIIHAWGAMTNFYAIPSAKIFNIPLYNSQIADAFPKKYRSNLNNILWNFNYLFSTKIIANSMAGLSSYDVKEEKGFVIYNGLSKERFSNLKNKSLIKEELKIKTPFVIVMVASFGEYKDYGLFFKVAEYICKKRGDVTFVAVGEGEQRENYMKRVRNQGLDRVIFTGRISNVEEIVNISDIGVLFSNMITGEGISNTIMEYMALSKPVVATDSGGTNELIEDGISGYLIDNNMEDIIELLIKLLNNKRLRDYMGVNGYKIIKDRFTVDKMGKHFLELYDNELSNRD